MKNKFNIVLAIILLLSIVACTKTTDYPDLDKTISNLSPSMKAFLLLDKELASSQSFQAVFNDLTKVKYHDTANSVEYTYYVYEIYLAPRTSRPLSLESVTVSPSGTAYDYLTRDYNNGRSNLQDWQGFAEKLDFPKWSGVYDFSAYRLILTYNDLGNDIMASYGVDEAELDSGMQKIKLRIKYDGGYDEIILNYEESPHVIESAEDPKLSERPYLKSLLTGGDPKFLLEPLQ